jgi:hypothetical protein
MKYITLLLLSAIMFSCCKTQQFPPTNEKAKQLKTQQKILDAAKDEVKKSWVGLVNGKWQWFKEAYNETLSDADIPSMSMVAIPVYRMDSISFYNFNSNVDIMNSITLEIKKAEYYVLKNNAFIAVIRSQYTGSHWSGGGYSGIYPNIAQKSFSLYSNGIPFYTLQIYPYQTDSPYIWTFYNNGKELIVIHSDGSEVPLIDELNQERNALKEWHKKHPK